MSAFGYTRYAQAFGVAANDAGTRISDKLLTATDSLAVSLFELGSCRGLEVSYQFLYPFVGGTQVSHSFNLADPDSKRIQFEDDTTVTHNQFGITGPGFVELFGFDGTLNAGTGVMAPPTVAQCGCIFGIYNRTAASSDQADLMASVASVAHGIYSRHSADGRVYFYNGTTAAGLVATAVANAQGFYSSMRDASFNQTASYKNGVTIGNLTTGQAANTAKFFLFSGNAHNLAFCFLSRDFSVNGLAYSNLMQASLYAIVQKFQTWCGRQV